MSDSETNPQQSNVQTILNEIQQHRKQIDEYNNRIRELRSQKNVI